MAHIVATSVAILAEATAKFAKFAMSSILEIDENCCLDKKYRTAYENMGMAIAPNDSHPIR
jgi:hypothetical protein